MNLDTFSNLRRELDRIEDQVRKDSEELFKLREIERRARDMVTAHHIGLMDEDQCRQRLVEALERYRPL